MQSTSYIHVARLNLGIAKMPKKRRPEAHFSDIRAQVHDFYLLPLDRETEDEEQDLDSPRILYPATRVLRFMI